MKSLQDRTLYRVSFEYRKGCFEYINIGGYSKLEAKLKAYSLFAKKYNRDTILAKNVRVL